MELNMITKNNMVNCMLKYNPNLLQTKKKHINENCVSVFASFGKKDLLGMPKLRVLNTMGIKSLDIPSHCGWCKVSPKKQIQEY